MANVRQSALANVFVWLMLGCTTPHATAPGEPVSPSTPPRASAVSDVPIAPTAADPSLSSVDAIDAGTVAPPEADNACAGDDPAAVGPLLANAGEASGRAWSDLSPGAARDVAAGKPLVVFVYVPLCSNQQIWCGSNAGGDPVGLNSNIYWGAIFGSRRFFDDYRTPYERVETIHGETPDLERIVYRQMVSGAPWGRPAGEKVEQIVVLQAVHGALINGAVERFWNTATRGGCVSFKDGDRERTERIHVVGYAGHNRLMDNVKLPPKPSAEEASPIPSFVLACFSERYFGPSLRGAGARPLVTTRSYMAPEGYLVRAIAEGLAVNESPEALRQRAALVQRSWQKTLSPFQSLWIFWPFEL